MFDAASRSDALALQRAEGTLRLGFKRRGAATVLSEFYQQGCLKARLPRHDGAAWPVAVTLNSSGGVAGGDRLSVAVTLAAGTTATVTAQAAERFYRALPGMPPARVRTAAEVGAGARLEWLPQETILFDRCALDRRLEITLAEDARFLGTEMLVFGRAAMGEQVVTGTLCDLIRLNRGGVPLWQDSIRLAGPIAAILARPAVAHGARAVGTIVHVGPDAADRLDAVRAAADQAPATADIGCSSWNGLLVARILATDAAALRAAVIPLLTTLRDGRPLPRVWSC